MKIVVIILTTCVFKCMSYQFTLQTHHYHVPIANIRGVNQSVLYNKDSKNDMLINSILKNISTDNIVVVISGKILNKYSLSNTDPNIIFLTKTLDIDDIETVLATLVHSYWSPLYLVVTTEDVMYVCENGTMTQRGFIETKFYLNELWRTLRIVRVIVSFPYTCPEHYFIYTGKEDSYINAPVYNRNIKLINTRSKKELEEAILNSGNARDLTKGYPLRANIFQRFPTSIKECDVVYHYTKTSFENIKGFCGLDGFIMQDYVDYYNFDLTFPKDDSCDKYGYVDTENNITLGSLGCIVNEKIDISFNSRFVVQYSTDAYYFLYYIGQDSLCAILSKPGNVPLWHYAHNILELNGCLIIIVSYVVQGTVAWVLAKIYAKISDARPSKLQTYIYSAIVSTTYGVLTKNDRRFKILKGSSLMCAIIILAKYQGHVNYQFTTRVQYPEIKTLPNLYESDTILYTSPSILELVVPGADFSPNQQAFFNRIKMASITYEEIVMRKNAATLVRKQDVMIDLLYNQTDKYGTPLLYVVEECFNTYYLAFIARNGFLFIEESLKFMMHILEAGLPNRYYIWTRRTFNSADPAPSKGPEPRPYKSIKLTKLRTAFGILIVGYVVSTLVFIIEIWKGKKLRG